MRASRLLPPIVACIAAACLPGCGYSEKGLGPPDIAIGPVAPLQFEIDNPTAGDLFIDWSGSQAHFTLSRSGQEQLVDKGCLPACGDACACAPCEPSTTQVRRIPAHKFISFSWTAERYVQKSCDNDAACACVQSWPLTAGTYEVAINAFASVQGGQPSATDPDVIVGATIDSASPACEARTTFSLAPSAAVRAVLDCGP